MSTAIQQKPQLQVKLSAVKGPHAGQVFQLNKDKISIGRGPENDIVLMNDPQVSRLHAQILLVDRDFEIIKLSEKNAVLVDGNSVDKWKLVNGSTFTVGDSEIKIEYDLGQAVVSVPPKKMGEVVPLRSNSNEATHVFKNPNTPQPKSQLGTVSTKSLAVSSSQVVATQKQKSMQPQVPNPTRPMAVLNQKQISEQQMMQQQLLQQQMYQAAQKQAQSQLRAAPAVEDDASKIRFYALVILILGGIVFFLIGPKKIARSTKPKPVLKYEDEINIELNSTSEKDLVKKREEKKLDRNSPQYLRAQENFIRGMRDYSLGNYARAQEFFQVVLNLDSDNALAKRHLYLSKVRFDELVQTKLMLGESYFKKHNFDMCLSMYQQVMNMLDDKRADTKYKLAEKKAKECELASEGIR